MYRICKQFSFEAAHSLPDLHDGHKCRSIHGHSYKIEITLKSELLNNTGMIRDFGELFDLKQYLNQKFDHQILNDIVEQPTVENIARHLFDWCIGRYPETESIRVSETETSWGEYSR